MEIPKFGLGTYTVQGENCSNIVYKALETGYRLIDTAELYQNHQEIALAIKAATDANICMRNDIWITSKLHNRDQRKLNIGPAIQKILLDLQTDYLDLLILHSAQKNYSEAYSELIRCASHFNIKHIGVSNFRVDELESIINKTGIKPYLNQFEISPFNQRLALRSFMAENNILTQAYGSLTCNKALDSEHLVSSKYDPDELLLGWATHYNLRPIPTAHTTDHVVRNYQTMGEIKLDLSEVEQLDRITDYVCNYKHHQDKIYL